MVPYLLSVKETGSYGTRFKALKGALYAYQLTLLLRTVAFNVYLLKDGDLPAYLTVDPGISLIAMQFGIFNKYTVAIFGLFALYFLRFDLVFFTHHDTRILRGTREILIENVAQCSTAARGPVGAPPGHSLRHWVACLGELTQFQRCAPKCGSRRLVTFRRPNLTIFPHLSAKHRAYLVLMTLYSETTVWVVNLITGKEVMISGVAISPLSLRAKGASQRQREKGRLS